MFQPFLKSGNIGGIDTDKITGLLHSLTKSYCSISGLMSPGRLRCFDVHEYRQLQLLALQLFQEPACIRIACCGSVKEKTYKIICTYLQPGSFGCLIVFLPAGISVKSLIGSSCLDDHKIIAGCFYLIKVYLSLPSGYIDTLMHLSCHDYL